MVVLKDKQNKKVHEDSAQLACEAAGAIRTVAPLTRETDCCNIYSRSLDKPLANTQRAALWSNLLWALSQAMIFFTLALTFWYGSRLVADGEFTQFHFFVTLIVGLICVFLSCLLTAFILEHGLWIFPSWQCLLFCSRHIVRIRCRCRYHQATGFRAYHRR